MELLSVTMNDGVMPRSEIEGKDNSSEDKSNYKVVLKGDMVYNSMRMWQGAVGTSDYDGIVSPAYTVLIPKNNCNGKFFMELFKKQPTLEIFKRWSQGLTSDTWNLKYPVLSTIPFMVPSVKEQEKIAEYFKSLDNLITLHQRKCEQTKELKKFMLQKMFPKKGEKNPEIRFPGFTDDWEERKLKDVTERVRSNDGRMDLPTLTMSASSGWLDQKDRFSGDISGKEKKNYTLLKKGELSYNHGNSKLAKYGVVFSLTNYEEALVPRVYHSFKALENTSADFIEYMFSTKLPDRELGKLISSGARMDGLLNISYDDFMNIHISIPNYEEQILMSAFFRKLDENIALHQRKCEQLKELKKFMLQNMFPKKG